MEDLPMYYLHKNGEILPYPPENPEEVDINRFLLQISLEEDGSLNFARVSLFSDATASCSTTARSEEF